MARWSMFGLFVRRAGVLVAASAVLLAASASCAQALGGGGTGGFSGGGGGGGGGGGFGGGGGGFGGGFGGGGAGGGGGGAIGVVFLLILLYVLIGSLRVWRAGRAAERREPLSPAGLARRSRSVLMWPVDLVREMWLLRGRRRATRLAAAEASLSDPRFAPEHVRAGAAALFRAIEQAWSADDRTALASMVAPDLMVEWDERLSDFARRGWRNEVEVRGEVDVDYVGLRNAGGDGDRRVVVRIGARVRDLVRDGQGRTIHRRNSLADSHHVCEYWTLAPRAEGWVVVSIEQHREGMHELTEPLVPTPWSDTQAIASDALLEQIAPTRRLDSEIAEVADTVIGHEAEAAALDLSLVDDRFAPRVLAAEAHRAVLAWAEAIDGDDGALREFATPEAIGALLFGGDPARRMRIVVRGPKVESATITTLDGKASPPSLTLELKMRGRRYVEDRVTTTVVQGERSSAASFAMTWQMWLSGDDAHPWRVVGVTQAGLSVV
ncbi:MAG: TIM44-like domain-containing protein [Solirubrobacteraceae bacterium]